MEKKAKARNETITPARIGVTFELQELEITGMGSRPLR
jgi:hypothetical protein